MLEAMGHVKTSMQGKEMEEQFDVLFMEATAMVTKLYQQTFRCLISKNLQSITSKYIQYLKVQGVNFSGI